MAIAEGRRQTVAMAYIDLNVPAIYVTSLVRPHTFSIHMFHSKSKPRDNFNGSMEFHTEATERAVAYSKDYIEPLTVKIAKPCFTKLWWESCSTGERQCEWSSRCL